MGKTNYFLCIGEAAQYLGVCTKTLRRWDKMGYFKPNYRTMGTHRKYSIDTLRVYSNTKEFKTHENKTSQLRCAV